jgi:hypothetical protein
MRFWKPEDIFTMACPFCQAEIEFWKDEPVRFCRSCQKEVKNPKMDLGCAEWCKHSSDCLDSLPGEQKSDSSSPQTKSNAPDK